MKILPLSITLCCFKKLSTIDYKAKGELLKEIAERNGTQDYYDEYFGQGNEDDEKLTSVPEETKSIIENRALKSSLGIIISYVWGFLPS